MRRSNPLVSAVISVAAGASAIGLAWGAAVATERLCDRREQQRTSEPVADVDIETPADADTEAQRQGSNPIGTVIFVCLTMIVVLLFAEWNASRLPSPGPMTDDDLVPAIVGLTTVLF